MSGQVSDPQNNVCDTVFGPLPFIMVHSDICDCDM